MDTNIIWSKIKKIRAKYIANFPNGSKKSKKCTTTIGKDFEDIIMPDLEKRMKNNNNSSEMLGIMSKKTGAEMFIFLNLCPSLYAREGVQNLF